MIATRFRCPHCGTSITAASEDFPLSCCGVRYLSIVDLPGGRSARVRRPRRPKKPPPAPGPGTELAGIRRELGLADAGCGCQSKERQLDEWGVAGCITHRAKIRGWLAELGARAKLLNEPPTWLNPRDPAGSLIDEAIRRAQEKSTRPQFVTTRRLTEDVYQLAAKLPPRLSGIIGVARSGVAPASLLAMHLHLPLWILRETEEDIIPAGHGWRLLERREMSGPLLVVDDTSMTGRSLKHAEKIVDKHAAGSEVQFAVIYRNPSPCEKTVPIDYYARDLEHPHFLEWNLFNSIHLPKIALDFDGILTHDGTIEPQYLPRKGIVPLVVTGRLERDRAASLAWLARWGVQVKQLVMWQGTEAERDQPGVAAAYKAEHFRKSGLSYFVESCAEQAREIARLTRKPVICPAAGKVF